MPDDPDRRTSLAGERTLLAWWRTGFTAIAAALALGRVVPALIHHATRWPYVVVGTGFALYGIALIGFGTRRIHRLNRELGLPGTELAEERSLLVLAAVGVALGMATIVLILVQ
jgi:putative membrane protein